MREHSDGPAIEIDGKQLRLWQLPFTIGRADDNSLTIADHRLSRYQCRIEKVEEDFVLVSIGRTAMEINGDPAGERHTLKHLDRITFGDSNWVFLAQAIPAAPESSWADGVEPGTGVFAPEDVDAAADKHGEISIGLEPFPEAARPPAHEPPPTPSRRPSTRRQRASTQRIEPLRAVSSGRRSGGLGEAVVPAVLGLVMITALVIGGQLLSQRMESSPQDGQEIARLKLQLTQMSQDLAVAELESQRQRTADNKLIVETLRTELRSLREAVASAAARPAMPSPSSRASSSGRAAASSTAPPSRAVASNSSTSKGNTSASYGISRPVGEKDPPRDPDKLRKPKPKPKDYRRILFVVDKSASMAFRSGDDPRSRGAGRGSPGNRKWDEALEMTVQALEGLDPDRHRFCVMLFSSGPEWSKHGWSTPTGANITATINWMRRVEPQGGTDPVQAMRKAIHGVEGVDAVVFLTDTNFSPKKAASLRELFKQAANKRKPIKIFHTPLEGCRPIEPASGEVSNLFDGEIVTGE